MGTGYFAGLCILQFVGSLCFLFRKERQEEEEEENNEEMVASSQVRLTGPETLFLRP